MSDHNEFRPPVRGGYAADAPLHVRNWRSLVEWLRTPFVTTSKIADLAVTNAKIQDAAIDSAKIGTLSADKITSGTLTADVTVSGSISTGAAPDQRVEVDADGIRAYDDADSQTVNIPTIGSPFFKGTVVADAIEINGNARIGSTGNVVNTDGVITLQASGVADPTTADTMSWGYDNLGLTGGWNAPTGGGFYDPVTDRHYLSWSTNKVSWFDGTSGAFIDTYTLPSGYSVYGITKAGTYWWVLAAHVATTKLALLRFDDEDLTGENIGSDTTVTFSGRTNFGITWDDANDRVFVLVEDRDSAPPHNVDLFGYWFTETRTLDKSYTGTGEGEESVSDIHYDGTTLWCARGQGTGQSTVVAYTLNYASGTVTRDSGSDFPQTSASAFTISNGASFASTAMRDSADVKQYEDWDDDTSYLHSRYTWYDSGGGETLGTTAPATVGYVARAKLSVSVGAPIPSGADNFRIYIAESASATPPAQTNSAYKLQATAATSPQALVTFDSGGAAIPSTNTTSAGNPGAIVTDEGSFAIYGSGTLLLPVFNGAPSAVANGQLYYDSGTNKAYVYNGSGWQALF